MAEAKKRGRPAKDSRETKKKPQKTTDKMLEFAAEYIIDWNGKRAYKAVYGNNTTDEAAAVSACRLLKNPNVIAEKERLLSLRKDERIERKARVVYELEKIAYDDLETDVYRDKDGEIIGVSRKDRVKALELLGKTEAIFTDRVEQTGPIEIKVGFDAKGV